MATLPHRRDKVFISYSRSDATWLNLLTKHLKPYIRASQMDVWDDSRINAGDDWRVKIKEALERAAVAVLLVTPDFLASDFIINNELPHFLEQARAGGLRILWIAVKASGVSETLIASYQGLNNPTQPLIMRHHAYRDQELNRMSSIIRDTWVSQTSFDSEAMQGSAIAKDVIQNGEQAIAIEPSFTGENVQPKESSSDLRKMIKKPAELQEEADIIIANKETQEKQIYEQQQLHASEIKIAAEKHLAEVVNQIKDRIDRLVSLAMSHKVKAVVIGKFVNNGDAIGRPDWVPNERERVFDEVRNALPDGFILTPLALSTLTLAEGSEQVLTVAIRDKGGMPTSLGIFMPSKLITTKSAASGMIGSYMILQWR